jgi:hypothetical protein
MLEPVSGIHEHQNHRYESLLKEGKTLVIVNGDPMQLTLAHRVLEDDSPWKLLHWSIAYGIDTQVRIGSSRGKQVSAIGSKH